MAPHLDHDGSELLQIASAEIAGLAERTGEAVALALIAANEAVYAGLDGRPARRVQLAGTAVGQTLAANQDETARRSLLGQSDNWQLRARLDLVRARGYAIEADEFAAGASGVAAPIVDQTGWAIAALAIEGPSKRLPRGKLHELAPQLIEATRRISSRFGGALRPLSKSPRPSQPSPATIRVVADAKNLIGESPLYDPANDRLFWVDMYDPAIFRLDRKSGQWSSVLSGDMTTVLALVPGGILIATQSGLWLADSETFRRIRHLGHPEAHIPTNRFNDGKCDNRGRFWVNTIDLDFRAGAGTLYRMEPDGSFAVADTGLTLPNGMAWSPDDRTMYLVETSERTIYAYDFSAQSGHISNRRVLVRLPDDASGAPDGMCVDRDGNLWVALFDGWRVSQFSSEGRLIREIVMPVPRPTSCALGPHGRTLFVTSARIRLAETTLHEAPHSGAVFEIAL